MQESIHFSDFDIRKGRIDFRCVHTSDGQIVKDNNIFFELSEPIQPSYDAIALACACMCGNAFRSIRLDIPVSQKMCTAIEQFTKSTVATLPGDASVQIPPARNNEPTVLLSFSSGTDSLATMSLLPRKNIRLVATDFGGWFERERIGYTPYNPEYLLKTNFARWITT